MKPIPTLQHFIRISLLLGYGTVVKGITFTDPATAWTNVVSGTPFPVTWAGNSGDVALVLANGSVTNPHVVNPIQTDLNSNAYTWTPGVFAIPGHTFFLFLNDSTGAEAFSPAFKVLATSAASSSTSSTPTSSPTSSASSSPTSSPTSAPTITTPASGGSGSGLSTGAKAGIGIGVALGVVLVALVLGCLAYRHRKAKGRNEKAPAELGVGLGMSEASADNGLAAGSGGHTGEDAKVDNKVGKPAELDGTGSRGVHELV